MTAGFATDNQAIRSLMGAEPVARIWDLAAPGTPTGTILFAFGFLMSPEAELGPIEFSPNGRWLVTTVNNQRDSENDSTPGDRMVRAWDLKSAQGRPADPTVIHAIGTSLRDSAISGDGRRVLTVFSDGSARIWNLDLDDLIAAALRTAGRQLSPEERSIYLLGEPEGAAAKQKK